MNVLCPERRTSSWRSPDSPAWIEIFLALCILGSAVELFWGGKIHDWLHGGKISRDRASIIAEYQRQALAGRLPEPAGANAFEIYHGDKNSPRRMSMRVHTQTGEIIHLTIKRAADGSVTNWVFR